MSKLDSHSATSIQTGIPHLAAQSGLAEWHRIVASSD
jgi:hypothetical protein